MWHGSSALIVANPFFYGLEESQPRGECSLQAELTFSKGRSANVTEFGLNPVYEFET